MFERKGVEGVRVARGRGRRALRSLGVAALLGVLACGSDREAPPAAPPPAPPPPASTALAPPAPPAPAANADDAAIAKAEQAYLDLLVEISPETATSLGLHAKDTELDDKSAEGVLRDAAREETMLRDLDARFANVHASPEARTDLAILKSTLEIDVALRRRVKAHLREPDVYASPMNAIFWMLSREYAPPEERAQKALTRIEKIPALLAVAQKNLSANPKEVPKLWVEVGVESASGAKGFFDEQRPILEKALPGEKKRIGETLKKAVDAYVAYVAFLKKDLLPKASGDYAVGADLFSVLLRKNYFLDEDAAALEARGRDVFQKTVKELDAVAHRIDPKAKSWADVTAKVKGHHPKADDLVASYKNEVMRARKYLVDKDAVAFPPGDECVVIETPIFQRSTIGSAAYDQPPPFDAVTKGFFFVTPVDKTLSLAKQEAMLREDDHGDQVDTAVHEAYPGHHLQLSFARLHPSLIRKATGPAIFAEGWALYAEELMNELGYYTDEERLMQLEWTLVRAARVILDVGLHTKGMKYDEAVKVLTDEVHLERPLAESEVKRYTEQPTQPLAYLVGREMIFRMRARYEKKMGPKYSLKAFHTEVLGHGTIAPGLLEREIFHE